MKLNNKIIVIISLALTLFVSSAHSADDRESLWFGTFAKKKLTEKYSYWLETQVRYGLDVGETKQVLYRTGLLRNLSDNQGLGFLYGYIETGETSEHRLTLQHTLKYGELAGLSFSHRARLEGRFIEDLSQDGMRLRLLLRASKGLTEGLSIVAYNELFVNLNETRWNGGESLDRNRLFLGLQAKILDTNKVDFGYLNQYSSRKSGDTSEHILFVGLSF